MVVEWVTPSHIFNMARGKYKEVGKTNNNKTNKQTMVNVKYMEVFLVGLYLGNLIVLIPLPSKARKRLFSVLFHTAFKSIFSV